MLKLLEDLENNASRQPQGQVSSCNPQPSSSTHRPPHDLGLRRYQVPQRVGRVVSSLAIIVRIHLKHILGPIRVMLQRGQLRVEG